MTTKARQTSSKATTAPEETTESPAAEELPAAEEQTETAAPAEPGSDTIDEEAATPEQDCIVEWCDQPEADGLGVCRPHHEAGWRYVREVARD